MKDLLLISFVLLSLFSCSRSTEKSPLKIKHINPLNGYSQIVEVNHNGLRTLYVSGQIAEGETKAAQIRGAFLEVENQLKDAGATMKDVVKMNTYIVDYGPEDLAVFREIRRELMGNAEMPASTLVGVSALALPEWMVEIEAVAVLSTN